VTFALRRLARRQSWTLMFYHFTSLLPLPIGEGMDGSMQLLFDVVFCFLWKIILEYYQIINDDVV
jgi:hypothetical protein